MFIWSTFLGREARPPGQKPFLGDSWRDSNLDLSQNWAAWPPSHSCQFVYSMHSGDIHTHFSWHTCMHVLLMFGSQQLIQCDNVHSRAIQMTIMPLLSTCSLGRSTASANHSSSWTESYFPIWCTSQEGWQSLWVSSSTNLVTVSSLWADLWASVRFCKESGERNWPSLCVM